MEQPKQPEKEEPTPTPPPQPAKKTELQELCEEFTRGQAAMAKAYRDNPKLEVRY